MAVERRNWLKLQINDGYCEHLPLPAEFADELRDCSQRERCFERARLDILRFGSGIPIPSALSNRALRAVQDSRHLFRDSSSPSLTNTPRSISPCADRPHIGSTHARSNREQIRKSGGQGKLGPVFRVDHSDVCDSEGPSRGDTFERVFQEPYFSSEYVPLFGFARNALRCRPCPLAVPSRGFRGLQTKYYDLAVDRYPAPTRSRGCAAACLLNALPRVRGAVARPRLPA